MYAHTPPPDHIFFDNNCHLRSHVSGEKGDKWFDRIGLPVDVFHYECKHKDNPYCQKFCNPADFGELVAPDGRWVFNSSVAEQTNVWLAGYNAMAREMSKEKFNFFFDELIMRRNAAKVAELEAQGMKPMIYRGPAEPSGSAQPIIYRGPSEPSS